MLGNYRAAAQPMVSWVVLSSPRSLIFSFLDRSRYVSFQVAPHLSSRGWGDPVPDPLVLRKFGRAENRTQDLWVSYQELWPLDHRGGLIHETKWIPQVTPLNSTRKHWISIRILHLNLETVLIVWQCAVRTRGCLWRSEAWYLQFVLELCFM
jgi:hypothetical protein